MSKLNQLLSAVRKELGENLTCYGVEPTDMKNHPAFQGLDVLLKKLAKAKGKRVLFGSKPQGKKKGY